MSDEHPHPFHMRSPPPGFQGTYLMLISMSVLSVLSLGHFISSSFTTEEEEMIWKLEKKIVDKRLVNSVKYHILP